jgi:hypothetical protein
LGIMLNLPIFPGLSRNSFDSKIASIEGQIAFS